VPLHKREGGVDLIIIPRDFASLCSTHMYDVGDRGGGAVVTLGTSTREEEER